MIFGIVAGTVVADSRSDGVEGARHLLVELCSYKGKPTGKFVVALDQHAAGPGEMVMVSQGSSCRQTEQTYQKAVDALIVGIIDLVEADGRVVYRK